MKLTKQQLKEIVKECLVEILGEGLSASKPSPRVQESAAPRKRPVDNIRYAPVPKQHDQNMKTRIAEVSGGDPVMASIFEDTARSTLPKMMSMEKPGRGVEMNGGAVELAVASSTPEELFGDDVADKWSTLAFAPSSPKILKNL